MLATRMKMSAGGGVLGEWIYKSQVFLVSATWVKPSNPIRSVSTQTEGNVDLKMIGGGGGGGDGDGSNSAGGGGGAASHIGEVTPVGNVAVTIGSGGGHRSNGTATKFGALASAAPGLGGSGVNTTPGAGGAASGSGFNGAPGGAGRDGTSAGGGGGGAAGFSGAGSPGTAGTGAPGVGGLGGADNPGTGKGGNGGDDDDAPAPQPGANYGAGGGGGGVDADGGYDGAPGAPGYALVEWEEFS